MVLMTEILFKKRQKIASHPPISNGCLDLSINFLMQWNSLYVRCSNSITSQIFILNVVIIKYIYIFFYQELNSSYKLLDNIIQNLCPLESGYNTFLTKLLMGYQSYKYLPMSSKSGTIKSSYFHIFYHLLWITTTYRALDKRKYLKTIFLIFH